MPRNSFIQMSKLTNVSGRITYISSKAKQENLYATYTTIPERSFWRELAKCNQESFKQSGTEGKCIEARELIIALPESFVHYEPEYLLKCFTDHFKRKYKLKCISALHHNKRKTNYHIHLIFAERQLLDEPMEKIATRNMFYDENGKHRRTKKEILDETGNICKKCKVIKKGEVYERNLFTKKNELFKADGFLDEVKRAYTDLINICALNEEDKLHVFDKNGMYLATKKIGKNNPKAFEIEEDNKLRVQWNQTVDRALISGVAEKVVDVVHEKVVERDVSVVSPVPLEKERSNLEIELSECTGVFRQKQRKELQERITLLNKKAEKMKSELSKVIQDAGYANAVEFYTELFAVREEKQKYEETCKEWKQECLKVEIEAMRDNSHHNDMLQMSQNRNVR